MENTLTGMIRDCGRKGVVPKKCLKELFLEDSPYHHKQEEWCMGCGWRRAKDKDGNTIK